MAFKPALLVVDMQHDFLLAPGGSNLVSGKWHGSRGAPSNSLLSMPGFAMRITALNEMPDDDEALAHNHEDATAHGTCIDLPSTKKGMSHKTAKRMFLGKGCLKGDLGSTDGRRAARERL